MEMKGIKSVARVIDPEHWPDSTKEDILYWQTRPAEERVQFGRELVRKTHWFLHGCSLPRMSKIGRIFKPEP